MLWPPSLVLSLRKTGKSKKQEVNSTTYLSFFGIQNGASASINSSRARRKCTQYKVVNDRSSFFLEKKKKKERNCCFSNILLALVSQICFLHDWRYLYYIFNVTHSFKTSGTAKEINMTSIPAHVQIQIAIFCVNGNFRSDTNQSSFIWFMLRVHRNSALLMKNFPPFETLSCPI